MSLKNLVLITVAVALAFSANGQNCTCESNFEWVKKTFEENDAGFQYIIDKKGQAAYDIHNQLMLDKVKAANTLEECTELLYEWLKFFRSGHIGIELLMNDTPTASKSISTPARWNGNISQFEEYIDTKKEVDFEGIWENQSYKIGIKKEEANYIGFIIEADVDGWREPGLVKLKIEQDGDNLKSTYFMRDYSPKESAEPELIGNNYMQIGQQTLKRLMPVFYEEPFMESYFKSINSPNPYLEELNETTLYLRIPSFQFSYKKEIDNVIASNKQKILNTQNLIIDVRDNGGGADISYYKLLPFIYTNPIKSVGVKFLSTELNNQRFLELATSKENIFIVRKIYKYRYNKLQKNLGEFVNLQRNTIYRRKTIYKYPMNVGIIINRGCASATEQFILEAKQSQKVKLFGTTTWGALDVSNKAYVESPCKEFYLWYCVSLSMRIPDMAIDDIGLEPDCYLDESIPQHKWVEFVNDILNQ
ncbi:MAG: S41 family peptidase [Marinilabiliaceae bacterium]|nr:S41 family peptidase [Marinilabiliaceae bacterium]